MAKISNKKGLIGFLAIANIVGFIAVLVINYLATSLPIGGMTTGELSDLYPNLFTPAGITFSIWGLIYLALTGFVVWQIVDLYKKKSLGITKKIGIWFLFSCVINIGWIFAWHYKLVWLSVIIMILFLIVLIVIANKVLIGKKLGNRGDKLLVQIPFSLYLGWISVATIANISTWLVNTGWNMRGMTDIFWTIVVIIVAALLALISLYKKYNIIFALVVIWAFIGIIIKRIGVDPVYASSIIWTTGVCIAVIFGMIGWRLEKWIKN
ncbi:tryptophan-rich sensory protein [Candidatus Gracilibacteria bacterium]|nr:tryptophan-rich sensory protein [Candidatus Gracilibacteria bacterium]